jgi:hypothetical protein
MKYKKATITGSKGFGMTKKDEDRLREQGIFYVTGYEFWIKWETLEYRTLTFVAKYPVEATRVFTLLAERKVVEATAALRKGPWTAHDLGTLLKELDEQAWEQSEDRRNQAPAGQVDERILRTLSNYALGAYHDALMVKHKESAEATEALQGALEEMGLELLDTGAMYSAEGEQEGPRDLVMGVPGSETEYAFRVYHDPRKAETDDDLPTDVKQAVATWEVAA